MTDLMEWAAEVAVPHRSDGRPRKVKFTAATLPVPAQLHTDGIQVRQWWRRPNGEAISIDGAHVTAEKPAYRALGLALLGYALSEQKEPLRIHLAESGDHLPQIVLWPGSASRVEALLGFRFALREVHYRARIFQDNPNYSTHEQDDDEYPREHLPNCRVGPPDWSDGYPGQRPDLPLCMHLSGTSASQVWLGKFLLNLALEDSHCRLSFLNNTIPSESLAPGSAELRLVVSDAASPPVAEADAAAGAGEAAGDDPSHIVQPPLP